MTLAEKIIAAAAQAQRNEAEAYATLEYILRERPLPDWLQSVAADVDGPRVPRDRPINQESQHVG
tara:strand:+ start:24014 stop:24208 length:195 start_codon:yes stop_codon:yes gene_type:complete